MSKVTDYPTCFQCSWLGLCVVACPLTDSGAIDPASSIASDSSAAEEVGFEIILEQASEDSSEK